MKKTGQKDSIESAHLDFSELANNSIVLTLQPQTALTEEQLALAEQARLLSETKKLICNACRVQNARDVNQLLSTASSPQQNSDYEKIFDGSSFVDDKEKIAKNLEVLIEAKILAEQDDVVKLISRDIKEQHRLRRTRKIEVEKLKNTHKRLGTKGKYYEEQADYYERYITDCLAKQTAVKEGKRKRSLRNSFRSKSTSTSVKYSAEELRKKQILISITENIDNWKRLQVNLYSLSFSVRKLKA